MIADSASSDFQIFRFDGIDDYLVKWSIGLCLFVVVGPLMMLKHRFEPIVFVVMWLGLWYTLIAGTYYALNTADVLVSDAGIARRLRGWISQRIDWSDVRLVREYFEYAPAYKATLHFVQIFPTKSSFFKFQLCESVLISDRADRFKADLIEKLNQNILKHHIKVQLKDGGVWERRQRLQPPH
jgi:hypothetical protein